MLIKKYMALIVEINFNLIFALSTVAFERKFQIDKYMCTGNVLLFVEYNCISTIKCSILCHESSSCQGIFYDHVTQTCRGCKDGVRHGTISTSIVSTVAQTKFYVRQRAITHGQPCDSSGLCGVRQYCGHTGRCICEPGFGYYAYLDCCSPWCLVYGNTYEEHQGKAILGHNFEGYTTGRWQCRNLCNKSPKCRTYDYGSTESVCLLQAATAWTHPDAFVNARGAHHYHRNCA